MLKTGFLFPMHKHCYIEVKYVNLIKIKSLYSLISNDTTFHYILTISGLSFMTVPVYWNL